MKKINKKWERIKRMSNDEELIFGADEEPVNNGNEESSVEDAAASDKASAETEETKAEEAAGQRSDSAMHIWRGMRDTENLSQRIRDM